MLIRGWMKKENEPETCCYFETIRNVKKGDIYEDCFGVKWIIDIIL